MNENKCSSLAREAARGADDNQLNIIYNKHESNFFGHHTSIEEAISGDEPIYTWRYFENRDAVQRCVDTNEVWTIEWSPKQRMSEKCCVHSPTLKDALRIVIATNEAYNGGNRYGEEDI